MGRTKSSISSGSKASIRRMYRSNKWKWPWHYIGKVAQCINPINATRAKPAEIYEFETRYLFCLFPSALAIGSSWACHLHLEVLSWQTWLKAVSYVPPCLPSVLSCAELLCAEWRIFHTSLSPPFPFTLCTTCCSSHGLGSWLTANRKSRWLVIATVWVTGMSIDSWSWCHVDCMRWSLAIHLLL